MQLPESPKVPMEFLSRSCSISALEVSKALSCMASDKSTNSSTSCTTTSILEDVIAENEDIIASSISVNQSFTSSATSQLVLERIMSQSEASQLTSGRLSHSSGPLNLAESESPSISPPEEFDDVVKYFHPQNPNGGIATASETKTVGRWLKDRKARKKEESRAYNAQLHAAVSVAAVAAAVAATAAATATSSAAGRNEEMAKTDTAVASAATLVAAQCAEAAEAMGVDRDHLASMVSSAVNVRSHDDITALTAAAATALRGAATLKARALKDVLKVPSVIPTERGVGICGAGNKNGLHYRNYSCEVVNNAHHYRNYSCEVGYGETFLGDCNLDFLARGSELLKRTRKGDLHWKTVSVYIHRSGEVMLKMKSRHVGGTITKKNKNVVLEICKDMPAWPGRHLLDGGDERRYFGLKTATRGMVEFECKNQREHAIWTDGVSKLLYIVSQRKKTSAQFITKTVTYAPVTC